MNYDKLNLKDLKEMCSRLGLPIEKKRQDLLNNIKAFYQVEEIKLFEDTEPSNNNPTVLSKNEISQYYFIITKIVNLYTYLNAALIYPLAIEESALYREENRQKDIFSQFPNSIILSSNPPDEIGEDEVLIKVIGDNIVVQKTNLPEIYFTTTPIPLSRLDQLFFFNELKKNNFLSTLKTFPDSKLNSRLCAVHSVNRKKTFVNLKDLSFTETNLNFGFQQVDYFDKLLGMFAFMKNAAIFYADKEGVYQEYPNTFFSTLQMINPSAFGGIYKENPLIRYLLFPNQMEINSVQRFIFKLVIDNILGNAVFDYSLATRILNSAIESKVIKEDEKNDIKAILSKIILLSERRLAYPDLMQDELFRRNLPAMCLLLLARFGNKNKQHTDKQSVRNVFVNQEDGLNKNTTEFLLAVLGLYYGYRQMIHEDNNLRFLDKNFEKAAEATQNIKFSLKNRLERVVIETAFQFSLNHIQLDDKFEYLASHNDDKSILYLNKLGAYDYKINYNRVLDTNILQIERVDLLEHLLIEIDRTYNDREPMKNQHIVHYIMTNIGLDKSTVLNLVRKYVNRIVIDDLADVIKFDRSHKKR